ncbi:MAG: septum formation protein Maf [Chlorobiaceae bacterium]|nr:septum formation protein Maf [Chlorobiaceae bacterium]MBA4310006.1 septum formation protein Maf [Chlorobiaceae bacterium]
MIKTTQTIYLASKSPRRKKLLEQVGLKIKIVKLPVDEDLCENKKPSHYVQTLALHKMEAAKEKIKSGIIITADTTVVLDDKIINKPKDKDDAFRILKKLSGRRHNVYTGFCVLNVDKNKVIVGYEKTAVTFRELTKLEILDYIESGSPMDKAGAYGIQDDFGAVFVKKINGCYYNVVGLPLSKIYDALCKII